MAMRTVAEHRAVVLEAAVTVPCVELPLDHAAGRTLSRDVVAAVDLPLWDNSAMDGFAVRYDDVRDASLDVPVSLRVVDDVPAGSDADPGIEAGEAVRIMTGAPLPTSADTVVPFEATVGGLAGSLDLATVTASPRGRGAHVRRRADDTARGDVVVAAGARLGARQLSAAAAVGVSRVMVTRAPRVAVLSTGDELRPPGASLRRGQIPESNATLLAGLVVDADAVVVSRGSISDDPRSLLAALDRVLTAGADVVVTSGGVSAGAFEVVRLALGAADGVCFDSVAMQPGRPQAFGVLPTGALFFGLPGNPVGVAVSFELFVRPALLRLQGRDDIDRPLIRLPAASGWRTPPARQQYVPARVVRDDPTQWTVAPVVARGSGAHLTGSLGRADAYAVVEPGCPDIVAGDLVDVMLLT